jgi:hypothetical protein
MKINAQRRHKFYVENSYGKNHRCRPAIITIEELDTNAWDILGYRTLPVWLKRDI